MDTQTRKLQSALVSSGKGAIILSLWSLIKMVLLYLFDAKDIDNMFEAASVDMRFKSIVAVMMFILLFIDFLFRLYVGRSAIKEGRGKRKGYFYLVCCVIIICSSVFSIYYVFTEDAYSISVLDTVVSAVIELTALITYLDITVSSIKLKKIRRLEDAAAA